MKRELSKDEKIQLGAKIFCGVLCVSLVSGTIAYYKAEEIKAKKQVAYEIENGLNGYEPIEETKNEVLESLMAKPLNDNQLAQMNKNVVNKNDDLIPGYDKYGQKYTFSDNGMGAPNEIPISTKKVNVINPNTGKTWFYTLTAKKWILDTHDEQQAEINKMQDRVVGGQTKWTDEEVEQFIQNMTINMGSMN